MNSGRKLLEVLDNYNITDSNVLNNILETNSVKINFKERVINYIVNTILFIKADKKLNSNIVNSIKTEEFIDILEDIIRLLR